MLKLTKLCGTAGNTDLRSGIDSDHFTVSDDDYPACSSPEPLFREELAAGELITKLPSNKLTDVLHDIQETLREETDPLETESQLIQSDLSLGHF